jgi:hypothetical protein
MAGSFAAGVVHGEDDGVEDLTVDIKTTTSHKIPLFKLKAWLESSGREPREAALKSKLR